jgi:carboxylate-amine ligase
VAAPASTRKVGVEEELMLVDPDTGHLCAVSHLALAAHRERTDRAEAADGPTDAADGEFGAEAGLEQELFLQQIETGTAPFLDVEELMADIRRCRAAAAASAADAGAGLVAVGTPVLGGQDREVTPKDRYRRIVETFGEVGRQGSVCGMHVHVDVADAEEAVRVMDRLRAWLPVLRALSVNSPYWHGEDTGYASWRSQVWGRWPSAGPSEPFGDLAGYRRATDAVMGTGAALDRGMLYLDARPSDTYPTVEVRVFDVVTEVDDIALIAAVTRGLVDAAAADALSSRADWRTDLTRAAHWLASRDGLSHELVHPDTGDLAPARAVVEAAIEACGKSWSEPEGEAATARLEQLLARGTGASRQRAVVERGGAVEDIVADLRERFTASHAASSR